MTPLADVRIVMWQGGGLWLLDVPEPPPGAPRRTDFHAHHALQVSIALDGVFELFAADEGFTGPAAITAPDVRHAFEPRGKIALLFVEPESPAGRAISGRLLDGAAAAKLEGAFIDDMRRRLTGAGALGDEALLGLGRGLIGELAGDADPGSSDPRVDRTLAWAAANLEAPLSISTAAARAGLSTTRMSHLFVEQTGLQFRTYVLWLRMGRAVARYAAGASLTEAAHEAGFSDSAHFSRTFRRMFGVAAAELRLT